jgi:hypothetical protein
MASTVSPKSILPEGMVVINVPDVQQDHMGNTPMRKHLAYDLGKLAGDPTNCGTRNRRDGGSGELCLVFFWYDEQAKQLAEWLGENTNINVHWGATSSANIVPNPTRAELKRLVRQEENNRDKREKYIQEARALKGPKRETIAASRNVFTYIQGLLRLDEEINSLYDQYFNAAVPAANFMVTHATKAATPRVGPGPAPLPVKKEDPWEKSKREEREKSSYDGDSPRWWDDTSSDEEDDDDAGQIKKSKRKSKSKYQKKKAQKARKARKTRKVKPKSRLKRKKSQKNIRKRQ